MNNVLLIDASPLFREFLKEKLSAEKVSVTVTQGKRDAFIKMISILPDLIIYEIEDDFIELFRFLEKKTLEPECSPYSDDRFGSRSRPRKAFAVRTVRRHKIFQQTYKIRHLF